MKTIGITGSIGMGKSFIADIFVENGASLFDADAEIHKMLESNGDAVISVAELFPEALKEDGSIDRNLLGNKIFNNPVELQKLESILHPLVRKKGEEIAEIAKDNGSGIIVKDIPLLFETAADKTCDYTLTAHCAEDIQEKRVMMRGNMAKEKLEAIKQIQMPPAEKIKRSDFNIDTNDTKENIDIQVKSIIRAITGAK